jgi:hypothetical protein
MDLAVLGTEMDGMAAVTLDTLQWAAEQFGACELGDARRTRRAVKVAAGMAADPHGSTPQQMHNWGQCKAAYRLLNEEDVTFQSLAEPHWRRTRDCASGVYLLLGDTTQFDFGIQRQVRGLGPTGDNGGRGFFLHSSLMVDANNSEVLGMAGQALFHRQSRKADESLYARRHRHRESEVWGQVIDLVGRPPEGAKYLHVFDRGADNFEVFCHLVQQAAGWVVRAAQLTRVVVAPQGQRQSLQDYLQTLSPGGTYELSVRAQKNQPARTTQVDVRWGLVGIPAPHFRTPWLKELGIALIWMWVVEVREINPPRGVQPLRWVLYTSEAVESFDDAWRVIGYYEQRPIIEEFHKGLKTACRLEERQYETSAALEALTGILSVVAVRLLQLRSTARTEPERPAEQVVPRKWLTALQRLRPTRQTNWTVRRFYHELAGLGGFLGRKGDGEPGWLTLWHGFEKLAMVMRYEDCKSKCG